MDGRKYDEAIEQFDLSLKQDPDHLFTVYNRGYAHYYQGDYEDALVDFLRALEIRTDYAEAQYNVARVHHLLGNKDEAIESYQRFLAMAGKGQRQLVSRAKGYLKNLGA
jgi:tetratricopeptide (TPR) repeat protein